MLVLEHSQPLEEKVVAAEEVEADPSQKKLKKVKKLMS
jgi:hypothetical protein